MILNSKLKERKYKIMASYAYDIVRQKYNVGTEAAPVWQIWFGETLAEAVKMGADDETTIVQYIDKKFTDLMGGIAPEKFDTIKEIGDYIEAHQEVFTALNAAVANKVDKVSGKGLSTNDYDNTEKAHVATAYNAATFTNTTPTVQAHGGIAAGTTFDNVPVNQILNDILYPWIAPLVSASITEPSNGGVRELGTTVNVTKLRAAVTKKSHNISKIEFFDGDTSLGVQTGATVANGGTFDFSVNLNVTANKNYRVNVTDAAGKVTSAGTGTFSFVYPYYQGVLTAGTAPTEALIKAMTKKVESKANKNYAYTCVNQRMCFAYPQSYGRLSKIFDPNNFDVTGTFTCVTVNITCADGKSVPYYAYVNDASSVSNFGMKFNY